VVRYLGLDIVCFDLFIRCILKGSFYTAINSKISILHECIENNILSNRVFLDYINILLALLRNMSVHGI